MSLDQSSDEMLEMCVSNVPETPGIKKLILVLETRIFRVSILIGGAVPNSCTNCYTLMQAICLKARISADVSCVLSDRGILEVCHMEQDSICRTVQLSRVCT